LDFISALSAALRCYFRNFVGSATCNIVAGNLLVRTKTTAEENPGSGETGV
jgi:hypothetical protein